MLSVKKPGKRSDRRFHELTIKNKSFIFSSLDRLLQDYCKGLVDVSGYLIDEK
jgi:hypothetical protein